MYYQEGLWSAGVDMELVLKRSYANTCEPQKPLQKDILIEILLNMESTGYYPKCPDTKSGVSRHIPGVSGHPFGNG